MAPRLPLKYPGGQLEHAALPSAALKRPSAHASQRLAPAAEEKPGRHCAHAGRPATSWYSPAPHAVHDAEPSTVDSRPGAHAAQREAELPDAYPGVHLAQDVDPGMSAKNPAAHAPQDAVPVSLDARPTSQARQTFGCAESPRRPLGHAAHAVAPFAGVYVPALHVAHTPLPLKDE